MLGQSPSIQSFFPLRSSVLKSQPPSSPIPGDGFTPEELATVLRPAQDKWEPKDHYDDCNIDTIVPGPKRIKIMGRIVNLSDGPPGAKLPMSPKGSLLLVIKDDTGALTVCFPNSQTFGTGAHRGERSDCLTLKYNTA